MKTKKWLFYALLASAVTLSVQSCGDDDPIDEGDIENGGGNGGESGGEGGGSNPDRPIHPSEKMDVAEQQEYLDAQGIKMLDMVSAEHINNIYSLVDFAVDKYADEYSYGTDDVANWFEACVESITQDMGFGEDEWGGKVHNYTYLFKLSNFTGHFFAGDQKWEYQKADDLQFTFKDQYGQECVAKVVSSGATKKVYVGEDEEYNPWGYGYNYDYSYDVYQNYVYVPEEVKATLTQNEKVLAELVVHPDLSSMAGEEFDLSKDNYSLKATTTVEDYKWNIKKAHFKADKGALLETTFVKGNEPLVSLIASYDGTLGENAENVDIKKIAISGDIMKAVQIKGDIKDWNQFYQNLEKADDNDQNESEFKSYLNMANNLMDLGVYYNSDVRQAKIGLMAYEEDYYGYNGMQKYFDYEPAISFDDGTNYSHFEAFFNEISFKKFLDSLDEFLDGYDKLVGNK